MAEAHQGVAFSFSVTEDEGLDLNVSVEAFKAVLYSGVRSWRKILSRFLNQVLNGVYPSHPLRGLAMIAIIAALKKYKNIDVSFGVANLIKDKIPNNMVAADKKDLVASIAFASGAWITIVVSRKFLLQSLFAYQGWMYELRGKTSMKTYVWSALLKFLIGSNPTLFSYQNSLPYLPVPNLKDTIRRYLRTVKPLYDDATYQRIEREAIEFQNGVGKRLQRYLIFKSYISSNYVSDWWEEYVYLRGRSPIMVNSNFYAMDTLKKISTDIQAARAANCIAAAFQYRKNLENQTIKANMLQDKIPLCSRQYERQFNTTRVPGVTTDKLIHYSDSKHVAVYCKGKWYKLYTYYQSMNLTAKELEGQIQKIIDDETEGTDCEKYLASLTAGDRIPWAQTRDKYFSKGLNKSSLTAIEKAAFVVVLDDEEYDYIPSEDRSLDNFARSVLHGKGYDRWFDKSFTMVISKNGRAGLNVEHSWADAPVTGHMWETMIADEIIMIGYDSDGHSRGVVRFPDLPDPIKLKWDFNKKIEANIMGSLKAAQELLNDVDLHVLIHDEFGKGFVKLCKTSPDAFIQMALQLAYFRDIGQHHHTYESSMTRLFREGRTETVRSCSIESTEWVKSMADPNATKEQKIKLFAKACDYHQTQYRDAMTGKGVDRHLFCLYVVSKYLELDISFLKEILSEPWRLSTSQSPASQTDKIDLSKHSEFTSAGGGFGPVSTDGYGISYIISGEDKIFFHISSRKSSEKTDSYRFGTQIRKAMGDIKQLFDKPK